MKQQDQHIKRAIEELRTYTAPSEVWHKIATELDAEQPLIKAIDEYKEKKLVAPDLFDEIIDQEAPKAKVRTLPIAWVGSIAAGLALLLGVYFMFDRSTEGSGQETITVETYTETTQYLPEMMTAVVEQMSAEDEVMGFIKSHCQQVALTCNTPQFQGLFDLYIELDESKTELLDVMETNQGQQELAGYLIRVEKEKDEVGKQLIQMIIG